MKKAILKFVRTQCPPLSNITDKELQSNMHWKMYKEIEKMNEANILEVLKTNKDYFDFYSYYKTHVLLNKLNNKIGFFVVLTVIFMIIWFLNSVLNVFYL